MVGAAEVHGANGAHQGKVLHAIRGQGRRPRHPHGLPRRVRLRHVLQQGLLGGEEGGQPVRGALAPAGVSPGLYKRIAIEVIVTSPASYDVLLLHDFFWFVFLKVAKNRG